MNQLFSLSSDAEKGLISCILEDSSNTIIDNCVELGITEDSFESPTNKEIFKICQQFSSNNEPNEIWKVYEKLVIKGINLSALDISNASSFKDKLIVTETSQSWKMFAKQVKDNHEKKLTERAICLYKENPNGESQQVNLSNFINSLEEIQEQNLYLEEISNTEQFYEHFQEEIEGKRHTPMSSGYGFFDKIRFKQGQYGILAGRPATGKSSLMINLIENIIRSPNPRPILIFSLEMSSDELMIRLVSRISGIPLFVLTRFADTKKISQEDYKKFQYARDFLRDKEKYFKILDKAGVNCSYINSQIKKYKKLMNIEYVFIDYLTLITPSLRTGSIAERVGDISRTLKNIAKNQDVGIMCLSQLNRESDKEDRPPRASDLRDSGQLEQDAYFIIILACVWKCDGKITFIDPHREINENEQCVRAYICKNRNGRIGYANLKRINAFCRFEEVINDNKEME